MSTDTLKDLYSKHTGYASDKWDIYLTEYQRLLAPLRDLPVELLEIGVQNGGSLSIWEQYFHNAKLLVGCDINPACSKLCYPGEVIKLVIGDVTQEDARSEVLSYSSQFNIIIDDGSHTSSDIIQSFFQFFPYLKNGGLYIVEDLHCSYWKRFQGGLFHPASSVAFFKTLVDILNFEHWGLELTREDILAPFSIPSDLKTAFLADIHSIEFINSMCIITKKPAAQNLLGVRHISGNEDKVSPVMQVSGTFNKAQPQQTTGTTLLNKNVESNLLQAQIELKVKERFIANQREKIVSLETSQRELKKEISDLKSS